MLLDWNIETVDVGDGDVGLYSSVVLDSNNNPHISYFDRTDGSLKYAKFSGTQWEIETIETIDLATMYEGYSWMTFYTSIGLDSSDNPHISYNKGYTSKGELRYAKWTGSEWVIQTVDSEFSSGFGEFSSIIIDSTDKPHISYKGAGYQVRYAHWTGTSWDIEIIYPGPQTVDMTSLALDSADGPHIIYFDRYNEDLVYARKISDEWITEPVDSGLANVYLSIDLDSADNPCITYSSYIHNS